jgi:hypothetical protein
MNEKVLIIIGVIIFLGLIASPVIYNIGVASLGIDTAPPELEPASKGTACIESAEWMRANHMQLLDDWRNSVVRDGNRIFINSRGERIDMSLQNTCLDCHTSKQQFCDKCHNYVAVAPKCWTCHIEPNLELPLRAEGE